MKTWHQHYETCKGHIDSKGDKWRVSGVSFSVNYGNKVRP